MGIHALVAVAALAIAEGDLDRLQGRWKLVRVEREGERLSSAVDRILRRR